MPTYRNNKFTKRNYDCTNIVFCQVNDTDLIPKPKENWTECDKTEIKDRNCQQLWIQGDVKYFGYL